MAFHEMAGVDHQPVRRDREEGMAHDLARRRGSCGASFREHLGDHVSFGNDPGDATLPLFPIERFDEDGSDPSLPHARGSGEGGGVLRDDFQLAMHVISDERLRSFGHGGSLNGRVRPART